MKNNRIFRVSVLTIMLLLLAAFSQSRLEAKPGSNEDPLVSKTYVDSVVRFKPFSLPAFTTIKLSSGSELVITSPDTGLIESVSGDLIGFVDLSEGIRAQSKGLLPYHHYLLANPSDTVFKFKSSITGFIRGTTNP